MREWEQGVFFNSGMFAGQIQKIFYDAQDMSQVRADPPKYQLAPATFAAGWYYGVSGAWVEKDIYMCFKEDTQLTDDLYEAMAAYIAGDSKTGDQKMKEAKPLWDTALSGCGQIAENMGKISEKFDEI